MNTNWRITAIEASNILGTCRQTVYKAIYNGELASEKISGRVYVSLDDTITMLEQLRRQARLLSCPTVASMLGVSEPFIRKHVNKGNLQTAEHSRNHGGVLIEPAAVTAFWQEHMNGVCVRCGILGEATAERGFMCVACEHEKRTGKLYRWPRARQSMAVHNGRLRAWGLVE